MPNPESVLDVGGTVEFWAGKHINAVLLNRFQQPGGIVGDACDLSRFADGQFECAFSNSVIGHVGDWDRQQQMAREIRRVGRGYFVQTPNHHFPIDWRTLVPFFHWLPTRLQAWCFQRFRVGTYRRAPDAQTAEHWATRIRNLTLREMRLLFPDAEIRHERVLGLPKSIIAVRLPEGHVVNR